MKERLAIAALIIIVPSVATMLLAGRCVELNNKLDAAEAQLAVEQRISADLHEELDRCKVDLSSITFDLAVSRRQLEELKAGSTQERTVETPRHYAIALPAELQTYTYTVCKEYEIPEYYELVLALMQHESNFVDTAVSPTDDYGLMQINKINHQWLTEELGIYNILDPYENIKAGIHMLSTYLLKYDDIAAALMCYNMGEPAANYCLDQGIGSTSYSDSILAIYREYIDIKIEE